MNVTANTQIKPVVLYDGECPLCQRSIAILKRLDWFNRLTYQNARDTEHLPESAVPLDPQRLIEEMHVVPADRKRVYAGFRAFRWIAGRLPLLWAIIPFLYLPGAAWIGQKVYLWVARNRFNLVPCKDGVCELPIRKK